MATYTENDVQNTLTNIRNRNILQTIFTHHEIPRATLYNHLNSTQFCRDIYDDK